MVALQPWPKRDEGAIDLALEEEFGELIEAIRVVRNLRAVAGLKPSQSVPVRFISGRPELAAVLRRATAEITALKFTVAGGRTYGGDASSQLRPSEPFPFLSGEAAK